MEYSREALDKLLNDQFRLGEWAVFKENEKAIEAEIALLPDKDARFERGSLKELRRRATEIAEGFAGGAFEKEEVREILDFYTQHYLAAWRRRVLGRLERIEMMITPCFVYFIGFDRFVKIGVAKDVKKRINTLTKFPLPVQVHRTLQFTNRTEALDVEARLHYRFRDHRLQGEWFTVDVLPLIDELIENNRDLLRLRRPLPPRSLNKT